MSYQELKSHIFAGIDKNHDNLAALNDDLADHPEISGQEFQTSRKIVKLLESYGYLTEYPYAGLETAFRAISGSNDHTYKIAIMTEYDALPAIGHACGHCLSCAISLLAGLSTKELQDELDADIHIIGTPIEETDGAKCTMIDRGVFDDYDMAIMVHLYNYNLVTPVLQGLANYMYVFHGKAAHASAAPWDGRNALNAVQLMFHAVDMLRQHTTQDAQFHGIVRNGGEAPNIVPEEASCEFYVRALERDYLEHLVKLVDDCAEGASIATQTTWEKYPVAATYANLKHNAEGEASLLGIYNELDIPSNAEPGRIFGSSDSGNVSFVCPTFHPCLQVTSHDTPIHTRGFADAMKTDRAHAALDTGAKIIALQIAKIFSDPARIQAMKTDFQKK